MKFLTDFTKLSKVIAGGIVLGYLIQLVLPSTRGVLALVPGRFIPCVWNIFTAGFLEVHFYKVIFSVLSCLALARIIEPVWGSSEFLKFLAATNVATGGATLFSLYIFFALTQYSEKSGDLLYKEVSGFEGIVAACLVAIKQIMPDNEIMLLTGVIRFRVKHLPSLFLVLAVAGSFLLGTSLSTVPFVCFGTYFAWVYLRFLQYKPELSARGDPFNEDFRFASFFPEVMQPPVDRVAQVIGTALRLAPRSPTRAPDGFVPGTAPLPGSDDADAARRRERGARALEERLGARKPASVPVSTIADIEAGVAEDSAQVASAAGEGPLE
ncbi:g7958 [Coccomyxa elongata]